MKKSFPVNLSGRIYYFDEDAYERLSAYYANLRQAFKDEDGDEIVSDIEGRVAELISENHSAPGIGVVSLEEVDKIITRVGRPEELADVELGDAPRATPPPYDFASAVNPEAEPRHVKRLYRDLNDRVIAGVLSGLAYYMGVNVTALRISVVILALFTWVGPLVMFYVIAWLLIPAAVTPRQILEMTGQAVTVDSVGRTTIFGSPDPNAVPRTSRFWENLGRIIGVGCMSILGFCGLVLTIAMTILLICSIAGFISYTGWGQMNLVPDAKMPIMSLFLLLLIAITVLIPAVSAVWASCTVLFKVKGVSRRTAITVALMELLLIIATVTLAVYYDGMEAEHPITYLVMTDTIR